MASTFHVILKYSSNNAELTCRITYGSHFFFSAFVRMMCSLLFHVLRRRRGFMSLL